MAKFAPKSYLKLLEPLTYNGRRLGEVFDDFVTLSACALAPRPAKSDGPTVSVREDEYLRVAERYDPDGLEMMGRALHRLVEQMQADAYADLLGPDYLELQSASSKRGRGEFYTPPAVSVMMAKMTLDKTELPLDRPLECCEPACGAGGMILAAAQVLAERGVSPLRMRWTAIDLNKASCDMTFINTTLWAVPCVVVHGDTIRMPVDDTYHYGTYPNAFYHLACGATEDERRVELFRKLLKGELCNSQDDPEEKRNRPHPTPEAADGGQIPAEPLVLGKGSEQGTLF